MTDDTDDTNSLWRRVAERLWPSKPKFVLDEADLARRVEAIQEKRLQRETTQAAVRRYGPSYLREAMDEDGEP